MDPPPLPASSYGSSGAYSGYPQHRQETNAHSTYHSHEAHRAAYTSERPPLHLQTSQLPQPQHPAYNSPSTSWKSDSGRDGRPAEYSSSVKRHLDMYDLEG